MQSVSSALVHFQNSQRIKCSDGMSKNRVKLTQVVICISAYLSRIFNVKTRVEINQKNNFIIGHNPLKRYFWCTSNFNNLSSECSFSFSLSSDCLVEEKVWKKCMKNDIGMQTLTDSTKRKKRESNFQHSTYKCSTQKIFESFALSYEFGL